MERFSCCSKYLDCSGQLKCLYTSDVEYEGCNYRKKLETGIIYYGVNRSVEKPIKKDHSIIKSQKPYEMYLACFGQLFAIYARTKNIYSQNLNELQIQILSDVFTNAGIPFRKKLDFQDIIDGTPINDNAPCNCRSTVKIGDEEFNVLAWNAYLMKQAYAEKITKAFGNKGFESRVEIIGSGLFTSKSSIKHDHKDKDINALEESKSFITTNQGSYKSEEVATANKPIRYEQATIFEILLKSTTA